MDIGIVGAGPAGLFIALCLLDAGVRYQIHLFESSDRIGGRTRMSTYGGVRVVAGAGIVRERDVLMRRLTKRFSVPLSRFTTNILRPPRAIDIMRTVRRVRPLVDRGQTFSENLVRLMGEEAYHRFVESSGSTDYQDADVCDTIDDYGFQDNTSGQVMFGIDWDRLMRCMLRACRSHDSFHLHLSTPITSVRRVPGGFSLNHDEWIVRDLFWTAPRPSWHLLPISSKKWRSVMRGVACQSFLRAYSRPIDPVIAKQRFPHTTYMPFGNPVQKIIPYRDGVYMVAYCDNTSADVVHSHPENLSEWTGVRWHEPAAVFYYPCGTHFFRPLDRTLWGDRDEFLRYAQHPSPHIYLCGEGLSRNQGWTEGALESVLSVL